MYRLTLRAFQHRERLLVLRETFGTAAVTSTLNEYRFWSVRYWKLRRDRMAAETSGWRDSLPENVRKVSGHINVNVVLQRGVLEV